MDLMILVNWTAGAVFGVLVMLWYARAMKQAASKANERVGRMMKLLDDAKTVIEQDEETIKRIERAGTAMYRRAMQAEAMANAYEANVSKWIGGQSGPAFVVTAGEETGGLVVCRPAGAQDVGGREPGAHAPG